MTHSTGSVSIGSAALRRVELAPARLQAGGGSPSDAEITEKAREILRTGDRFLIGDDHDARARHFAREVADLSPQDGARLIRELIKQDPGAIAYWMDVDRMGRLADTGGISATEHAAVANAYVAAVNGGQLDAGQAAQFLGLDALEGRAPALLAESWNRVRAFLGAADDAAADTARLALAAGLLDDVVRGRGDFHSTGVAIQLASDTGDPSAAARQFVAAAERAGDGIANPAQAAAARAKAREALLAAVGESSIGFENSRDGRIPGLVNPMAALVDSVARQPASAQWRELSVDIARFANTARSEVFFDPYTDKPRPVLAASLTRLLQGANGGAVLEALTTWDTSGIPGKGGHAQQYGQNAIELGNLLRITAFNPDHPLADQAMAVVAAFAESRKAFLAGQQDIPGLDPSTARQQLGMLGAAAFDAVQQMNLDRESRAAATQALVGFAVDVGLAVVPGGGKISALVAGDLKAAFGNNPRFNAVIDEFIKPGDTLTARGVSDLKAALSAAVGESAADLESLRANVSQFVAQSVIAGLPGGANGSEAHRDIVASHVQVVQTEIQDVRGR